MITVNHQKGITLIEVMISVSLGIVFLLAAMSFLLNGQQSSQSQDSGTRIQENARFAMDMLRESVRMAGYSADTTVAPAFVYRAACGAATINGLTPTNCADDTATAQGDRLAVAMNLDDNDNDCLGTDITTNTHIANVFWVEQSATNTRANGDVGSIFSLYCRGWDVDNGAWFSAAQPLVDGVDHMQVEYGIYNAGTDSVDRYLNAAGVEALTNGWANVQSVRIALLVSSGVDTNEADTDASTIDRATVASQYTNFSLLGVNFTSTEWKLRRVYTGTITLNNAL